MSTSTLASLRLSARSTACSAPSPRSSRAASSSSSRSEEHTSELQSLMRISYAVFCLKKKNSKSLHFIPHHQLIHYLSNKPSSTSLNTCISTPTSSPNTLHPITSQHYNTHQQNQTQLAQN